MAIPAKSWIFALAFGLNAVSYMACVYVNTVFDSLLPLWSKALQTCFVGVVVASAPLINVVTLLAFKYGVDTSAPIPATTNWMLLYAIAVAITTTNSALVRPWTDSLVGSIAQCLMVSLSLLVAVQLGTSGICPVAFCQFRKSIKEARTESKAWIIAHIGMQDDVLTRGAQSNSSIFNADHKVSEEIESDKASHTALARSSSGVDTRSLRRWVFGLATVEVFAFMILSAAFVTQLEIDPNDCLYKAALTPAGVFINVLIFLYISPSSASLKNHLAPAQLRSDITIYTGVSWSFWAWAAYMPFDVANDARVLALQIVAPVVLITFPILARSRLTYIAYYDTKLHPNKAPVWRRRGSASNISVNHSPLDSASPV